jgi:hypothetical protein
VVSTHSIIEHWYVGVGVKELVLDHPFISQKSNCSKQHRDVARMGRWVVCPLEECFPEGRTIVRIGGEEGKELASVPYSFFLVRW